MTINSLLSELETLEGQFKADKATRPKNQVRAVIDCLMDLNLSNEEISHVAEASKQQRISRIVNAFENNDSKALKEAVSDRKVTKDLLLEACGVMKIRQSKSKSRKAIVDFLVGEAAEGHRRTVRK